MSHPILECTATIGTALKSVSDVDPIFMRPDDKAAALLEVTQLEAQLAHLRLRVMAGSEDLALETGARDVAGWLAQRSNQERGELWVQQRLAGSLKARFQVVGAGLREGRLNLAQAKVIVTALEELPADLDADTLLKAEEWLVGAAARFSPKRLRVLGRKILDVVAPDIADEHEGKALQNEEQRANDHTYLRLKPLGNGITRLTSQLPDAVAAHLKTVLEAYTSPRHDAITGAGATAPDARVPADRRRGIALRTLLERLNPRDLPQHGGDTTTVMVTIPLDQLRTELGVAGLIDNDDVISAAQARRLACQAHIIPAVLGTNSEILDLGRGSRLFSPAQRKALRLRDRHCRAEGCTIPATWCEAHHRNPWSQGGNTDLDDGVLLCAFHHHRAHDANYHTTYRPYGDVRFHRRT